MKILKKWNLKDAFCRQISETDFELGNRYFCRRISLKDGGFRTIRFNGPDAINIGKKNPRELDLSFYGDRCSFQEMKYSSAFLSAVAKKTTPLEPAHLEVTFQVCEDRQQMTIIRTYCLYPDYPAFCVQNRIRMGVEPNVFWNTRPRLRKEFEGHFPPGVFPEGCVDTICIAAGFRPEGTVEFHARTDFCDNQVEEHAPGKLMNGNILTFSDKNGNGLTWLQEAPCSEDRRDLTSYDFRRDGKLFYSCGWGVFPGGMKIGKWYRSYRTTLLVHPAGCQAEAVRDYVRFRSNTIEQDLKITVNPWGCGKFYKQLTADFLLGELKAAGDCGSDLYQVDDGWQDGGTLSDLAGKNTRIDIKSFWKIAPKFWNGDFAVPRKVAEDNGVELALWCAPTNNIAYSDWREFADILYDFHKKYGIKVFKLDGITLRTDEAEDNFEAMLQYLNRKSNGSIRFNFDVTYGQRGGYFRFLEYGSIFLENRYLCHPHGLGYHPERTLRNLWRMAKWVPAQKLQIEVPWPGDINRDFYRKKGESFPDVYPWEYWLAIPMVASPLLWFTPSALPDNKRAECRKMMELHRKLHSMLANADVIPVGEAPTGSSVTGFLARGEKAGYLVLFREKDCQNDMTELSLPILPDGIKWEKQMGDAEITASGSNLTIRWKSARSFTIYTWTTI